MTRTRTVELTVCPDGPLLARGADVVCGPDGVVAVRRPVVALCVCGKSQRLPWCDGTHKVLPTADAPEAKDGQGTIQVGPLRFSYGHDVLAPRPWTVAQAVWAAELGHVVPDGRLLELGAGAGHVGLVTAWLTGRSAVLVDASPIACHYARLNAGRSRLADKVEVRVGLMEQVVRSTERFPLILADPPYIPTAQTERFPDDPLTAIDGGPDGLVAARTCLDVAARHVTASGALILQLRDERQVRELASYGEQSMRLREVRVVTDGGSLSHWSPVAAR